MTSSLNVVEIDLRALAENYKALKGCVGPQVKMLAVVKSDAYGHGMIEIASTLSTIGVATFGVAEVWEGVLLRESGINGEIVVFLGCQENDMAEVFKYNLRPVIFDEKQARDINAFAVKRGKKTGVYLKVDTGMGRLGIMPDQFLSFTEKLKSLPFVDVQGVMSHFPAADQKDGAMTNEQNRMFASMCSNLSKKGVHHIANSAALIQYPKMGYDMVRPGISLYGCYPSKEVAWENKIVLSPVMSFKTKVIQVKEVPANYGISYGHTYITQRPSTLAILPVGYSNGYIRKLSNRAHALINGQRVPQVGRVCMNVCVFDVTDVPHVKTGDEAVLLGRQGEEEINADEMADWMETINYEVLCLLGKNNHRIYTTGA